MYEEMLKYLQPPPRPKVKLTQEVIGMLSLSATKAKLCSASRMDVTTT
jgi:hypothetical protein